MNFKQFVTRKTLTVAVALLAILPLTVTGQFFVHDSDLNSIGMLIDGVLATTQRLKPDEVFWFQSSPMWVDGVYMEESAFRDELEQIVTAAAARLNPNVVVPHAYEGIFGVFRDFFIEYTLDSVQGDSCVVNGTFRLYESGIKESAGLLKFYRVYGYKWRLDTIDGYLPLLRSEIPNEKMEKTPKPLPKKKKLG